MEWIHWRNRGWFCWQLYLFLLWQCLFLLLVCYIIYSNSKCWKRKKFENVIELGQSWENDSDENFFEVKLITLMSDYQFTPDCSYDIFWWMASSRLIKFKQYKDWIKKNSVILICDILTELISVKILFSSCYVVFFSSAFFIFSAMLNYTKLCSFTFRK